MGLLYDKLNDPNHHVELGMAHLFKVRISGLYNGSFTQASGLSATLSTYEYREGGENSYAHHLPDSISYGDVTLNKGVVRNDSDLWFWFRSYFQLEGAGGVPVLNLRPRFFRDVSITCLSNNGLSLVIYRLYRAFVKSINPGSFSSQESAFHGVSVTLGHHGVDAEFPIRVSKSLDVVINEGVL